MKNSSLFPYADNTNHEIFIRIIFPGFLASWIPYVLFSNEGMKKELKWHA